MGRHAKNEPFKSYRVEIHPFGVILDVVGILDPLENNLPYVPDNISICILDYDLPALDQMTAEFLGFASCTG